MLEYFNETSFQVPFTITFVTDGDEVSATAGDHMTDEINGAPGGIVGFKLDFQQLSC